MTYALIPVVVENPQIAVTQITITHTDNESNKKNKSLRPWNAHALNPLSEFDYNLFVSLLVALSLSCYFLHTLSIGKH